jgi:hypothetical protein
MSVKPRASRRRVEETLNMCAVYQSAYFVPSRAVPSLLL